MMTITMRAILAAAMSAALLPAWAGATLNCNRTPRPPACASVDLRSFLRPGPPKTILDARFTTPTGLSGDLFSGLTDDPEVAAFRLQLDPAATGRLLAFSLQWPVGTVLQQIQLGAEGDGASGVAPDQAFFDTATGTELSVLFDNGLGAGQSSSWISLRWSGGFGLTPAAAVTDFLAQSSQALTVFAPVPEPATAPLVLAGLAALLASQSRRASNRKLRARSQSRSTVRVLVPRASAISPLSSPTK